MKNVKLLRILALSLLMFLCISCGKSESKRSTAKSNRASRGIYQKISNASQELEEFATEKGLMEDPRIKDSKALFFEAHKAVTQLRKSHPDLMPIYEKSDALESLAIKSSLAKDDAAYKQAMADYKVVRTELEGAANKLPEIIEAQKQVTQTREQQTLVLCDVVAESGAEGKKLADHVRKLLQQRQAGRK